MSPPLKSGLPTLLIQFLKLSFQFLSLIIISRFLTPTQVGIFSLAAIFVAGLEIVRDLGFKNALFAEKTLSEDELNKIFWVSALSSGLLFILTLIVSTLISLLIPNSNLLQYVSVLSICIFISGLQSTSSIALAKSERFFILNMTDLFAQFLGGSVGIVMALNNFGVISLLAQYLLSTFALAISRFALCHWKPGRIKFELMPKTFYLKATNIFLSKFSIWLSNNVDNLVVPIRFLTSDVGTYMRAFSLTMVPQQALLESIESWALPTLKNRMKGSGDLFKNIEQIQILLIAIILPANLILFSSSSFLVNLLLGENWSSLIPLIQLFALAGPLYLFNHLNRLIYILLDETSTLRNVTISSRIISIILVIMASSISLSAIAFSYTVSGAISWIAYMRFASRKLKSEGMNFFRVQVISLALFIFFISVIWWMKK